MKIWIITESDGCIISISEGGTEPRMCDGSMLPEGCKAYLFPVEKYVRSERIIVERDYPSTYIPLNDD